MDIKVQKAFDFASDLVKQLIALSTGVIALTVTFAKDVFGAAGKVNLHLLILGWIAFFLSILFGIWALMALTGTLDPEKQSSNGATIRGGNCRVPVFLQIVMFLAGLLLTIWYAVASA